MGNECCNQRKSNLTGQINWAESSYEEWRNQKRSNIRELPDMNRQQFIAFLKRAMLDGTTEASMLYNHLLKNFTDSDGDFDGKINFHEFNSLIDLAAVLPRKLGLAPSNEQSYKGNEELMKKVRAEHFNEMDSDKNGVITFDEFLKFYRVHIKAKLINYDPLYALEQREITELPDMSKNELLSFLNKALKEGVSVESRMLYNHLLKCFLDADGDFDGKINKYEFSGLVDRAAILPRKHGLAPTAEVQFKGDERLKMKVRTEHFNQMDSNRNGVITFDEFLAYTRNHIREKLKSL